MAGKVYPQYKVNCWFNESDDSVTYGVDIKTEIERAWRHVAIGNRPLFFPSRDDAIEYIRAHRLMCRRERAAARNNTQVQRGA